MLEYNQILIEILKEHKNHPKWEVDNALFYNIKTISNTNVGQVGQDFIVALCDKLGIVCELPLNKKGRISKRNPWDIKLNGVTFELKTATEDTCGSFQFNHIRYHRPYEAVLCLGVSPCNLYFGVWSKADISTGKAGNLVSMEKGANASYKLTKSVLHLHDIKHFSEHMQKFINNFT